MSSFIPRLQTVPLLAVLATATPPKASHASFWEPSSQDLNRYQGPTRWPIVFAKKSFFNSDLSVQPSVLYRLVTLPTFATSIFNNSPDYGNLHPVNKNNYNDNYENDKGNNIHYDDNGIDTERPLNYFKGDSRLYAKKPFGNFGLSSSVGPKSVNGYQRRASFLQGGYYRPWDAPKAFDSYESIPTSVATHDASYKPSSFAKNQPH